uniref:Uncharacterized protein n=1 Tax=Arundo donax TaxID=35708 RepID=A0A0A9HNW7_ARUDO
MPKKENKLQIHRANVKPVLRFAQHVNILTLYFTSSLLFLVPECPVYLHNKEELLPDERTIFVIHDLAIPSHPVRDTLYLH